MRVCLTLAAIYASAALMIMLVGGCGSVPYCEGKLDGYYNICLHTNPYATLPQVSRAMGVVEQVVITRHPETFNRDQLREDLHQYPINLYFTTDLALTQHNAGLIWFPNIYVFWFEGKTIHNTALVHELIHLVLVFDYNAPLGNEQHLYLDYFGPGDSIETQAQLLFY